MLVIQTKHIQSTYKVHTIAVPGRSNGAEDAYHGKHAMIELERYVVYLDGKGWVEGEHEKKAS